MPTPLPPQGQVTTANEGEVFNYLSNLAQEAKQARAPWDQAVATNYALYQYGDETPGDGTRIILHEIRNAIIAITDIQTQEPPAATLEPVETGEPPVFYWAGLHWAGSGSGSKTPAFPARNAHSGIGRTGGLFR